MKKSDIAMIILIASVSMLLAYFIAKAIIGDTQNQSVQVKTAEPITTEVVQPDTTIFNKDAVNPTVEVTIGDSGQSQTDQP